MENDIGTIMRQFYSVAWRAGRGGNFYQKVMEEMK
jgi:hypothetical protein